MDRDRFRIKTEPKTADSLDELPAAPPPKYPSKKKASVKGKGRWAVLTAVLIIVIALAGIAYHEHKKRTAKTTAAAVTKTVNEPVKTKVAPPPAIATDSHTSPAYATTFNYPSNWMVVDSGSAPLTVTSPAMTLTSANGQSETGQVVMTLAKGGALPPAFGSQSVAVMTSQTIDYSSPATDQAADTYVSFVQYPATTIKGGLDAIYLTGNYGYQKDQSIPASNLTAINPLVDFSFYSCASASCPVSSRQPLTIAASEWSSSDFSTPINTIIRSFVFD